MQKVNAIQNSKTMSDKEKERAMTKLAAEIEKVSKEAAEKEAAAKKKEEDAAGKPIDQYEKVEMKGLDKFTSEEKERKQKAMAGANIDYGDNVQGATNTLDTSAEKARVDGMTGQFEPGYQAPGTVTEADKQRLIEKGGPGTRF